MKLLLSALVINRLHRELRHAGQREIGGLLMGEHVQDETFRVMDISVQHSGGSHGCFVRDPARHEAELQQFFAETGENYARFNYLGEWHSHPSFDPIPSLTDIETMQSMVEDPARGVNFLVLMVARLSRRKTLEATAMAFRGRTPPVAVTLISESDSQTKPQGVTRWWLRRIFRF